MSTIFTGKRNAGVELSGKLMAGSSHGNRDLSRNGRAMVWRSGGEEYVYCANY